MKKYRLIKELPDCKKGKLILPTEDGKSYVVSGSDMEFIWCLPKYKWDLATVKNNPEWFEEIKEDEHPSISEIWKHQSNSLLHPLTCGNDSRHQNLEPIINADGEVALICPDCNYYQIYYNQKQ